MQTIYFNIKHTLFLLGFFYNFSLCAQPGPPPCESSRKRLLLKIDKTKLESFYGESYNHWPGRENEPVCLPLHSAFLETNVNGKASATIVLFTKEDANRYYKNNQDIRVPMMKIHFVHTKNDSFFTYLPENENISYYLKVNKFIEGEFVIDMAKMDTNNKINEICYDCREYIRHKIKNVNAIDLTPLNWYAMRKKKNWKVVSRRHIDSDGIDFYRNIF
jgi:hypothetical protein